MPKILIAEDDQELAEIMRRSLLVAHSIVELTGDGDDAYHLLSSCSYDLLIIDWGLPGLTGFEICRRLRGSGSSIPVLMVTGKDTINDKEAGFSVGVDDYLTKPFNVKELVLRVQALLRRAHGTEIGQAVLCAGDIELNQKKHLVTQAGKQVHLAPKEFALLELFMRHPGELFSPDAIIARLWPSDTNVTDSAIRTIVKQLRKKLDDTSAGTMIENVHSMGYRFVPGAPPDAD